MGRKVNKRQLLSDIYAVARASTALPMPIGLAAISMYRLVILQMRQLIQHRDAIEAEAIRRLSDVADFWRQQQIPGIGPIHALTITGSS